VPIADVRAGLRPAGPTPPVPDDVGVVLPQLSDLRLLPGVPFAVHTAPGRPLDVEVGGAVLPAAAFELDDPQLAGYAVLDFGAFDWLEEDEPVVVHPKDPFHRVAAGPRRAGRARAGRVSAPDAAVRDPAAGALLPAPGRRPGGAGAQRHPH